jgi:hypothetical protein
LRPGELETFNWKDRKEGRRNDQTTAPKERRKKGEKRIVRKGGG